jgi:hypothetical protein
MKWSRLGAGQHQTDDQHHHVVNEGIHAHVQEASSGLKQQIELPTLADDEGASVSFACVLKGLQLAHRTYCLKGLLV